MLYSALAADGQLPPLSGPEESAPPEDAAADPEQPAPEPEPLFDDIDGHWAQAYIEKAAALGLVERDQYGRVNPDSALTRQDMMVLVDGFVELPEANGLGFDDDGDIALWALESAARTTAAGIFQGSGGKLLPKAAATRAEAATVLAEVLDYAA